MLYEKWQKNMSTSTRERNKKLYRIKTHHQYCLILLVNSCFVFSTCFNKRLLLLFKNGEMHLFQIHTHTFRNRTNTSRVIHFLFEWSLYYQRSTWVFFQQIKRKRASLFLFVFHHLIRQRQHLFFYMNVARYYWLYVQYLFVLRLMFFYTCNPFEKKKTREFRLLNLKSFVMLSLLDICIDGGGYVIREIGSTIV